MKYVRTLCYLDKECWSVCYVIRNHVKWSVTGLSVFKLGFKQQSWIFLAVYTEYLMSLMAGSDIERFLEGDRVFK
jgi:hypothetical protein